MRRNVNYTCRGNVTEEFQKSKRENKKMIMKRLRFHPEGQSMHYIMLVRGKNTKKHCTRVCLIVSLHSKAPFCVLCNHIYTTL